MLDNRRIDLAAVEVELIFGVAFVCKDCALTMDAGEQQITFAADNIAVACAPRFREWCGRLELERPRR